MLAQNYQDPILFWAVQFVESASLRKVQKITPFFVSIRKDASVDAGGTDMLPAVTNTVYIVEFVQKSITNSTAPIPHVNFYAPFSAVIDFEVNLQVVSAGNGIAQLEPAAMLASRVRYEDNAATVGIISVALSGYALEYST
jgi:hypothetical protein